MQFDSEKGQFKLGAASFAAHQASCEKCAPFSGDGKDLAALCLEGSVLWKAENVVVQKRGPIGRSEHWRPKAEVKAAMKYKGDA